jgi:tetratricopeptide (TPR) repeat protein
VYRSDYHEAIKTFEESLTYLSAQDDPFISIAALSWLGWAYYELGELDQAGKYFQDAYEVGIEQGNVLGLPYALSKLGTWADAKGQFERGAAYHQEALRYFEAVGDQAGQGYALSRVSLSAWGMKDYNEALEFALSGYKQFNAIGHRWGTATSLVRIGFAELALKTYEEAQAHFYEGLALAQDYKFPATANYALIGLAMLWAQMGENDRAAELLILAVGSSNTPFLYQAIGRQALAEIEDQLPPGLFDKIQKEAGSKTLQNAIDEIQRDLVSAIG